jgi:hypothetical protein
MDTVFNESYVHACESLARGYQTPGARDLIFQLADKAGSFNNRYARALYNMRANEQIFTDDDMVVLHELLVYSTIEMMRALHIKKTDMHHNGDSANRNNQINIAYLQSLNGDTFQNMLSGFGAQGAINNRTYSACGLSISLGENTGLGESPQNVFGGIEKGRLPDDKFGSRYFDCPKCGKENERKKKNELMDTCKHCKGDVTCGIKKPKTTLSLFALAA